jgi:hypothetical protein
MTEYVPGVSRVGIDNQYSMKKVAGMEWDYLNSDSEVPVKLAAFLKYPE